MSDSAETAADSKCPECRAIGTEAPDFPGYRRCYTPHCRAVIYWTYPTGIARDLSPEAREAALIDG